MNISLLPPNATDTERKLEQALAIDSEIWISSDLLHLLRTKRPLPFNNYFAAEWGVAQFRAYFTDDEAFFAQTIPWLQMRGTAAAVKAALAWINVSAELSVEQFHLHVNVSEPFVGDFAHLQQMIWQSIPLHLDFYRIYHEYDIRHGEYDTSRYDDCLYDADSGVVQNGVLVSYGHSTRQQTAITLETTTARSANRCPAQPLSTWRDAGNWSNLQWRTNFRVLITEEFA